MGIGNQLIGDVERLLVAQTLGRRSLFRMTGARSQCWRAETDIEQTYPGMRCLLLPSATMGLALLLELIDIEPGREVLITPFGWLSNWSCIRRSGLVPRFLPLDRDLQLDPAEVEKRITERTGAVIVTHLMGRGQQRVADIAAVCTKHKIPLLEDIAQSFGISVEGQRAGTFGAAAWCSLNHHKLLSVGDGGFVLVRDERLFARLSCLHDQGCIMRDGARRPAAELEPGLSLRSTDLAAAVLRAQIARFNFIRNRILRLNEALASACASDLGVEILAPHRGDVPFTVLFRRPPKMNYPSNVSYPSLAESGWHVAAHVPWLATTFADAARDDASLAATYNHLAATSAVGAGFVDPYYAIPLGLSVTDTAAEVPAAVQKLREFL
jgi:dTDP-4-amino-4,6-dideoxygalactose transaminase